MARSECVYSRTYEPDLSDSYAPFQEDGSNCSIFAFNITADKSRLPLARNAVRKMRTLRHPGVIRIYDTVEVQPSYRGEEAFGRSLIQMIDRDIHLRCNGEGHSFRMASKA